MLAADAPFAGDFFYRSGHIVGRYVLEQPLSLKDGVETWAARHMVLKSPVMVSVITEHAEPLATLARLDRFRARAKLTGVLAERSRNVLAVIDADILERGVFVAFERAGEPMSQLLRREGPMRPARVAAIVDQIADALGAAHADRVVHGHLDLDNVYVRRTSRATDVVKVDGFTPTRLGTGKTGVADLAQDRFSLAAIAYEALTGTSPFVEGISSTRVLRPSFLRSELSPAVDEWFARALHADATKRFVTLEEMTASLDAAVGRERVVAPPSLSLPPGSLAHSLRPSLSPPASVP